MEKENFGRCYFKMSVDSMDSGFACNQVAFTLHDSIYSLYSNAKLQLNDDSSLFNEYLGFVNGTNIDITFGNDEDNQVTTKYVVERNSTPNQISFVNGIGGEMEINMVHRLFSEQEKISKSYNSTIKNVVSKLLKSSSINKQNLDETLNNGIWYQNYVTNADFVINYLLPFACSPLGNSPFYCFIDNNNELNFKNYNTMMLQTPIQELTYINEGGGILGEDSIVSVNPIQVSLSEVKPKFHIYKYNFDSKGNISDGDLKINDFPKGTKKIPYKTDLNLVTSVLEEYSDDIKLAYTKNNNKGYEAYQMKDTMFSDKLVVVCPLNRKLCSGKIVKIKLPLSMGENKDYSLRNNGNYIIESSYHKWDGVNGSTTLVCGKRSTDINPTYKNYSSIII